MPQRLARAMRLLVTLLTAFVLAACGRSTVRQTPPVTWTPELSDVTLVIGTLEPTPTPFVCVDWPGLTVSATVLPSGLVAIRGEGFLPGEETTFVASAKVRSPNREFSSTHEARPAAEIGEDGRLYFEVGLGPLEGLQTTWHIAIIHSRGVACTTVVVR